MSSAAASEMLAMMEGQLGRLSDLIRQKDAEVRLRYSSFHRGGQGI